MSRMWKRQVGLSALIVGVVAALTFGVAWALGIDFEDITEADHAGQSNEDTRFGDDGVTICVEGYGASAIAVSSAEQSVIAGLVDLAKDPLWSRITSTNRAPEEMVNRGCTSQPMALQPGVTVVDRGGEKGILLEGIPTVSEADPTDIRVYILTPEDMATVFGATRKVALTAEAWMVSGDQAWGVNQALYVSSEVADGRALIAERLRRATGLWEPNW